MIEVFGWVPNGESVKTSYRLLKFGVTFSIILLFTQHFSIFILFEKYYNDNGN